MFAMVLFFYASMSDDRTLRIISSGGLGASFVMFVFALIVKPVNKKDRVHDHKKNNDDSNPK